MSYLKPQTPLQHKDGDYFYPLTTIDQVIMEDGITRLNGADLVSVNTDGAPEGETIKVNADTLGGISADKYATVDDLNGKLSTDKIVNNFTTTEEGFVADARALKVLNDSKLSMDLLWENASPTSSFAGQTITIAAMDDYDTLLILAKGYMNNGQGEVTLMVNKNSTTLNLCIPHISGSILFLYTRSVIFQFTDNKIIFGSGYENSKSDNERCIPTAIYGIKGVSA